MLAKNNDYEMILMDLQMPVVDGFEATRQIREFDTQTPIIAMSANVFADAKQRAIDAGATDFLDKPIIIDKVISLITKYIVPEVLVEEKAAPLGGQVEQLEDLANKSNSSGAISVFSQQRFEQLTHHDSELQSKLIEKFHRSAPSMILDAFDYLAQDDRIALERNLHTLKSMAASIGGLRFADLMGELEDKARKSLCDEQDLREGEARLIALVAATESYIVKSPVEYMSDASDTRTVTKEEQRVKLLSLLEAYDNDATQYVSELRAEYPNSAALKDVQSALDNYDFERARFSRP